MIETFLADLDRNLRVGAARRRRIVGEARDHLLESARRLQDGGMDHLEAERESVARFGAPGELARGFNLQAEAAAMRARPLAGALGGTVVGVSFVLGVRSLAAGRLTGGNHWLAVTGFQLGLLSAQVALVAGICVASRVVDRWSTPEPSLDDRRFVTGASRLLAVALACSVGGLGLALSIVASASGASVVGPMAAVGGMVIGSLVAATWLLPSCARVEPDPAEATSPAARRVGPGELVARFVVAHPVGCVAVTAFVAGLGAMSHAETTVWRALPWGIGEALAVVAAFVLLGPTLGLRVPRSANRASA